MWLPSSCIVHFQQSTGWRAVIFTFQLKVRLSGDLRRQDLKRDFLKSWASLVAQWKRICLPVQETRVWSLGWKGPLEQEMATHSSILAWEDPMDRGAWQVTDNRVAQSPTRLHTHTPPQANSVLGKCAGRLLLDHFVAFPVLDVTIA